MFRKSKQRRQRKAPRSLMRKSASRLHLRAAWHNTTASPQPVCFLLEEDEAAPWYAIRIERTRHTPEDDLWAIRRGNMVLCKHPATPDGHYVFAPEPLPSQRNEAYLYACRFTSALQAFVFWQTHRPKILATANEERAWWHNYHGMQRQPVSAADERPVLTANAKER